MQHSNAPDFSLIPAIKQFGIQPNENSTINEELIANQFDFYRRDPSILRTMDMITVCLRALEKLSIYRNLSRLSLNKIDNFIIDKNKYTKRNTNNNLLDFAIICQLKIKHRNLLLKDTDGRLQFISILTDEFERNPNLLSSNLKKKLQYDSIYSSPHTIIDELIIREITDIAYSFSDPLIIKYMTNNDISINYDGTCYVKASCASIKVENRAAWALQQLRKSTVPNGDINRRLCHVMRFQPSPYQISAEQIFDILFSSEDRTFIACLLQGIHIFNIQEINSIFTNRFKQGPPSNPVHINAYQKIKGLIRKEHHPIDYYF